MNELPAIILCPLSDSHIKPPQEQLRASTKGQNNVGHKPLVIL